MDTHEKDVGDLRTLAAELPPGSVLRNVIDELVGVSERVIWWDSGAPTSGYAMSLYEATEGPQLMGFKVHYQSGNLGNLVHELTHVAVHESYGKDFVIFGDDTENDSLPPPPTYGPLRSPVEGTAYQVVLNEADRQEHWRRLKRPTFEVMAEKLSHLCAVVQKLERGRKVKLDNKEDDCVKIISDRIMYGGGQFVHTERDSVINQVLLWLQHELRWHSDSTSAEFGFFKLVEQVAQHAYERRRAAVGRRRQVAESSASQSRPEPVETPIATALKAPLGYPAHWPGSI